MCRISGESRCIDVARFWPIGPLRSVSSASIMPLIFESGGSALARFGTAFASSPLESIFLPRHRHPQVGMRSETEIQSLRELLNHERNLALAKVREYRTAQEEDALPPPSDELDSARALADVETHASLIEHNEERLRAIDFAFNMLEQGRYGQCAQCGKEIPLERLKVVPFAGYCVDCQSKRNHARRVGEGTVDEPFGRPWDLPEEMAESTETSRDEFIPISQEGPEGELGRACSRRLRVRAVQCGDRGRQLDAQRNAGHRNELSPKGPVPGAFGDV
jgi:DnaK suppressor protein